jgi:Xaa-Pro aminopeptidase
MLVRLQSLLEKYGKKVLVMYNKDNSDKYFCKYISDKLASFSICIVSSKKAYILVNSLDFENVSKIKYNKEKICFKVFNNISELDKIIEDIIAELKFPNDISLSYSTMGDKQTDILSHGQFIEITKILKRPYRKYLKNVSFSSSENIIYEVESEKTELEIQRLKLISSITVRILEETINNIKVLMTEKEIVNLTHNITKSIMQMYIGSNDIKNFDFAWENCPIVLTGSNLSKGGHSLPDDKKLQRGDTIYFDFGIKVTFSDDQILYTDLQRMGYVLKDKEQKPPKAIQKVFDTLVDSIEEGIENLKPNVKAYIVDKIVRQKILKAGYPDYLHATGHPVGREVHDIGAVISLKSSKRANLNLVENGVYTLEPRVNISNGGSIEEMILVTKYGGVPLCNVQNELYIIK